MRIFVRIAVCAAVLGLAAVSMLPAQVVTTAQILGTVVDSQGLPVHGARCIASNELTGETFVVDSNELGNYLLRALPVGPYSLSAGPTGFKRSLRRLLYGPPTPPLTRAVELTTGRCTES